MTGKWEFKWCNILFIWSFYRWNSYFICTMWQRTVFFLSLSVFISSIKILHPGNRISSILMYKPWKSRIFVVCFYFINYCADFHSDFILIEKQKRKLPSAAQCEMKLSLDNWNHSMGKSMMLQAKHENGRKHISTVLTSKCQPSLTIIWNWRSNIKRILKTTKKGWKQMCFCAIL